MYVQRTYNVAGTILSAGDTVVKETNVILSGWNYQMQKTLKKISTVTMTRARKVKLLKEPWGTLTMFGLEKTFLGHPAVKQPNLSLIPMNPPYASSPVIAHLCLPTFAVFALTLIL